MSTVAAALTVDEFLKLPEQEGQRMELIRGEVVTVGSGRYRHEVVKSNVVEILTDWVLRNKVGKVFSETMYRLDVHNSLIPDVSIIWNRRLVPGTEGLIQGAPELAVEVVSSESASYLETKINLYLANGSRAVWVIYPESRTIRLYDQTGQSKKLTEAQILEAPDLLPGFSALVSAFFDGI